MLLHTGHEELLTDGIKRNNNVDGGVISPATDKKSSSSFPLTNVSCNLVKTKCGLKILVYGSYTPLLIAEDRSSCPH